MSLRVLSGPLKASPVLCVFKPHNPLPVRGIRIGIRCASSAPRAPHAARHARINQSTVNWTSIAVYFVVGTVSGIAIGAYKSYSSPAPAPAPASTQLQPGGSIITDDEMSGQLPKGRPGTLSPEEEAKLRELWRLMLQISSPALPTPNGNSTQSSSSLSRTTSESGETGATPEKKKKSRLSFLKKKKHDESHHAPSSAPLPPSTPASVAEIADGLGDDKHGTTAAFKAALAESKPEDIHEAFWSMVKHDHPDALLLRFLRARKWDVNAALVMAISALHWRLVEAKVDADIMANGEEGMLKWSQDASSHSKEGEDFMSQIRMGKSFLHGRDKEGRPICYVRVRLHKPGQECEEAIERFTVYTIETARMFLRPPVDTATVVFDMTDFGMANMDYAPVKFMIKCFEANYPESLGVVLVHNAPWIFNTVWKIIKGWLDPVVASKIHFTNNLKDVEGFIDKNMIIKELGGPLNWQYKYTEPIEGENAVMEDIGTKTQLEKERADLSKEYESVVLDWISSTSEKSAITPQAEADELRKRRDEVAAKLRSNYWKLDPHVRARSVYDRIGELRSEGASRPANSALNVPASGENSSRPSIDSVAQSFHTARQAWEDDVD